MVEPFYYTHAIICVRFQLLIVFTIDRDALLISVVTDFRFVSLRITLTLFHSYACNICKTFNENGAILISDCCFQL